MWREREDFRRLAAAPGMFAALNVTTGAAWLSFFHGLKHLEPAVAATLYNGIGPFAVLALGSLEWVPKRSTTSPGERLCYIGLAGVLAALVAVVLSDRSGLSSPGIAVQAGALAAVVAGGVMIAISHMLARWFNEQRVGSIALMGTRFLLGFSIAVGMEATADSAMRPALAGALILGLAVFAILTVPSFMLQLGIARASPLAVNIIRALGPVSVFAVQQVDGRLKFSDATLFCIRAFCILAVAASVFRAWSEAHGDRMGPPFKSGGEARGGSSA